MQDETLDTQDTGVPEINTSDEEQGTGKPIISPEEEQGTDVPIIVETSDKRNANAERRINKLTAEKYALQGKLDELNRQSMQQPTDDNPMPTELTHPDWNDLEQAKSRWVVRDEVKTQVEKMKRQELQENQRVHSQKILAEHAIREEKFTQIHGDYEDVVRNTSWEPSLDSAITSQSNSPDLAYHIANSPALHEKLNGLAKTNLAQMLIEIGKLSANLDLTVKHNRTTNAPPPITTIKGSNVKKDDWENMSVDDMAERYRLSKL